MRDLAGHGRLGGAPAAGRGIRRRNEAIDGERPEGALIGEHDGELSVRGMLDVDADALVPLGGGAGRAQQQLAAHAEVADDGLVGGGAADARRAGARGTCPGARRAVDDASGERRLEVRAAAGVPGQRALVEHA